MTKQSGIYKITNAVNGKCYVGSAVNIAARWSQHLSLLHKNKHHSIHLQHAFNKWGECAFEFSVVEIVPDAKMLISREQSYIDTLSHEYNIAPNAGSTLGVLPSAEARQKMSASHTGNQNSLGYKHSPATRANMSAAAMGRVISPETRTKLSVAQMGRKKSPEAIAKTATAHYQPVSQFTTSGEFVAEFQSLKAAEEATGAHNISLCCNDKRNFSGGFCWKYKEMK